jgi:hypothetical protein
MRLPGFVLVVCLLFAAIPCQAQRYATDRGVWSIGGTARFSHLQDRGNDIGTGILDINPRVSYFVGPGLAASANLQFARFSSDGDVSKVYGIGPGLTYYLIQRQTLISPFVSLRTLWTHTRSDFEAFPTVTTEAVTWLVSAGAALFLARNAAITGELFYTHLKVTDEFGDARQSNDAHEYGTQFGVTVYLF